MVMCEVEIELLHGDLCGQRLSYYVLICMAEIGLLGGDLSDRDCVTMLWFIQQRLSYYVVISMVEIELQCDNLFGRN